MPTRDHVPSFEILRARKRMNDAVRHHFDTRGFLEVETPVAVTSPGLEPHLLAFETTEFDHTGARENLYLHTSPEYAMKRMLGRGVGDIYQLARVFRNGERSDTHAAEFTMLEWYRAPGAVHEIMDDVDALIEAVARAVGGWRPARVERVSVSDAFRRAGLGDPLDEEDFGQRVVPGDTFDDAFHRAFLERVEPTFDPDVVTILHGYPASMAALARIDPNDPRRAERFEVFVGRIELANAFGELTDPIEQRRRFEDDLRLRREQGRPAYPIDEGLLEDLANIDTAAGIALGLDRLLMRCLDIDAIQDVIPFAARDD